MKRKLIALLLILAFGAARIPIEDRLSQEMMASGVHEKPLDASVRERLPQLGFMAALGGLRSLVASVLDLKAYMAFEEEEWASNEKLYDLITTLQPRNEGSWDTGTWHRLRNATGFYKTPPSDLPLTELDLQERIAYYEESGFRLLEQGLRINPESARLHDAMGGYVTTLSRHSPSPDGRKAAQHYMEAFRHGGRLYHERMAAYELAKLPETENKKKAYEILYRHYRAFLEGGGKGRRFPGTALLTIRRLEDDLEIPAVQRAIDPDAKAPSPLPSPDRLFDRLKKGGSGE